MYNFEVKTVFTRVTSASDASAIERQPKHTDDDGAAI